VVHRIHYGLLWGRRLERDGCKFYAPSHSSFVFLRIPRPAEPDNRNPNERIIRSSCRIVVCPRRVLDTKSIREQPAGCCCSANGRRPILPRIATAHPRFRSRGPSMGVSIRVISSICSSGCWCWVWHADSSSFWSELLSAMRSRIASCIGLCNIATGRYYAPVMGKLYSKWEP